MEGNKKHIKALISGLLANDDQKVARIVNELSESILPQKEKIIMKIIIESLRGELDV